jgi:RHS repeat-associated protein
MNVASHTFDPVGNRTSATSTFSSLSPGYGSYNADDQLSSETYDANGNTTHAANGNTYTYDSENHMTSMTGNGKVITMTYDAFGNRVAKTVNGVTTQYLVEDDVNPTGLPQVLEEVQNGAAVRTYTYGLQRISQSLSPIVTGSNAWTTSFYGYDGGGSVRQLTNSAGVVTDEYLYDAFGNSFTKTGTTPNNYLYRGEQYDSDLGLYYLRARYYNPATGRFLSRDPNEGQRRNPMSLHKYLYANGDPINRLDPFGREVMLEVGSLDAIIGTTPVPALVELAGGTATAIAAWAAALEAGMAEIAELLAEAAEEYSMGMLDAAEDLLDAAVDKYMDLLTESSKLGGLTRFFTCEALAFTAVSIYDEFKSLPKLPGWVDLIPKSGCVYLLEPAH